MSVSVSAFLTVLLAVAASASARPAEGGRYVGDVSFRGDRCRNCVRLVVANDGRELQRYSAVDLTRDWRQALSCDVWFSFDAWTLDDRYRVRIRSDGAWYSYLYRGASAFVHPTAAGIEPLVERVPGGFQVAPSRVVPDRVIEVIAGQLVATLMIARKAAPWLVDGHVA